MAIEKVYGLLKLDINPNNTSGEKKTIAIQGDYNSRYIYVELMNGKSKYTFANSAEIRVNFQKGNKSFVFSSFQSNAVIERRNGGLAIRIPLDVANETGTWKSSINIIDGNSKVSTQPFNVVIESTLSGGDTSVESEAVDMINDALTRVDTSLENVSTALSNVNTALDNLGELPNKVDALEGRIDNIGDELEGLDAEINAQDLGLEQDAETSILYPTYKGVRGNGIYIEGGSGGGGSTGVTNFNISNNSGAYVSVAKGKECIIRFSWSSYLRGVSTGNGLLTVNVGKTTATMKQVYTGSIQQGSRTLDISPYLSTDENLVQFKITDAYAEERVFQLTVNVVELILRSTFNGERVFSVGETVNYLYTAQGNFEKTMVFEIDGVPTTFSLSSSMQQSYSLPANLAHGVHYLNVYYTTSVNDDIIKSNEYYYTLIYAEENNSAPIVAPLNTEIDGEQYSSVNVEFKVYSSVSLKSNVSIEVLDESNTKIKEEHYTDVSNNTKITFSYIPSAYGENTVKISSGDTSKVVNINIQKSSVSVSATDVLLDFYMSATGRNNNESNPSIWKDSVNGVSAQLTDFNYITDGWTTDNNGDSCLRVTGDARVYIPYEILKNGIGEDGMTIEVEFATSEILDYDVPIITCWDSDAVSYDEEGNVLYGKGLKITPQYTLFRSSLSDIKAQYKEDEHIRYTIVIERVQDKRLGLVYLDGIMSAAFIISATDNFRLENSTGISIGSNYCTTDIYNIRVYNRDLTRHEVLNNWIGDTQNGTLRRERYERNNIYNAYSKVAIENLPSNLPYMIVKPFDGARIPTYKGDTQNAYITYVNTDNPSKSFTNDKAETNVQGTSSQGYFKKNLKIKYKSTFDNGDNKESKYKLRNESIPVSTFTYKADVASSEGANNVELVRLYNDAFPFETPGQARIRAKNNGEKARLGIDGLPIVMFTETDGNLDFYGKMNFNNDKSTGEIFGFVEGDEYWQVENNSTSLCLFRTPEADETVNWGKAFSCEYPKNYTFDKLQALYNWITSTCTDEATNNPLQTPVTYNGVQYTNDTASYRLAKFKNELSNWFVIDNCSYYFVFVHFFLLVDSFAKNSVIVYFAETGKYYWYAYDMDTAIGIDNEGQSPDERDYYCEWGDSLPSGNPSFNGEQSTFWQNFSICFADKIAEMYAELRRGNLIKYDVVNQRFEDHQAVWSEAIFNEDSYEKCIYPYRQDWVSDSTEMSDEYKVDSSTYIGMLHGSKANQRKWWLYNRFRYFDSKYNVGEAKSKFINCRFLGEDDIEIVPYADIYATIDVDGTTQSQRKRRGQKATFHVRNRKVSEGSGTDAVLYIYSAPQISEINGLDKIQVVLLELDEAKKLKSVVLGDEDEDFENVSLTKLTVGSNRLLRTINLSNCKNFGTSNQTELDLSGCTNIENILLKGTKLKGVSIPNGGNVKKLKLPYTMVNLIVKNQKAINTFEIGSYVDGEDNEGITLNPIESINIINSSIDTKSLIEKCPNLKRMRLEGINWSFDTEDDMLDYLSKFDSVNGITENNVELTNTRPVIQGTIHIPFAYTSTINKVHETYPLIDFTYDYLDKVTVKFINGTTVVMEKIVSIGDSVEFSGTLLHGDLQKFIGWVDSTKTIQAAKNVQKDLNLYAEYIPSTSNNSAGSTSYYHLNDTELVIYGTGNVKESFASTISSLSYTKVRLQEGITELGSYSFNGISALTNVVLPTTMKTINNYVFTNCTSLSNIYYTDSIISIGAGTFKGCTSIETFRFPDNESFKHVTNYLFDGCTGLKTVVYNKYIETIGQYSFNKCGNMSKADFPNTLTTIGNSAFRESGLASVTLGENVTALNKFSFCNISTLKNVSIGEGITTIPELCFAYCGIETLTIEKNITSINGQSFYSCNNMKNVIIKSTSANIGSNTFAKTQNVSVTDYHFPNCTVSGTLPSITIAGSSFDYFSINNANGKIYFATESIANAVKNYTNWVQYKNYITYEV